MAASDYPNGRIPLSELVHVGNGQYLEPTTAAYWSAMVVVAAQAGVPLACLEGYRSYDEQVRLRNLYLSGQGNPAGIPGTSQHGYGKAVDIANVGGFSSSKYAWLRDNAPGFGFSNAQGASDGEAWHWVYIGGANAIAAGQTGVPITSNMEDEMRFAIIWGALTGASKSYLYDNADGKRRYITPLEVSILGTEGVKTIGGITQPDFDAIPKRPGTKDHDGSTVV